MFREEVVTEFGYFFYLPVNLKKVTLFPGQNMGKVNPRAGLVLQQSEKYSFSRDLITVIR
jgi:hypothetical protein